MPLPIPTIMENASNVLKLAKEFTETDEDFYGEIKNELREALKKVSPDDLLAVMNEVGKVYVGMYNQQILGIGAKKSERPEHVQLCVQVNFGLGPHALIIEVPFEGAKTIIKVITDSMGQSQEANVAAGKLLTV
jgi:hypothetical protein